MPPDAFATLYRCYRPRLARFLAHLGHRPAQAEEIIDDTMMVVWRRAQRVANEDTPAAWIFEVARRLSQHARSRAHAVPMAIAAVDTCDEGEGPEARCARLQADARLHAALARLSREQRAVVALTYLRGCSCHEAARELHCPVGTVKSRLALARQHLRESLAPMRAG